MSVLVRNTKLSPEVRGIGQGRLKMLPIRELVRLLVLFSTSRKSPQDQLLVLLGCDVGNLSTHCAAPG